MKAGWVAVGYLVMSFSSIVLNIFVLCRLFFLAKRKRHQFMTGCGLPLVAMTTADLLSIVSIVANILFPLFVTVFDPSTIVRDFQCKVVLFMLHTMTAVSVWCWLLATLMRYVAVYYPQMHLSRWRLGYRSLGSVIFVSALMNCWVPITAMTGNGLCIQKPLFGEISINRALHGIDIFWSYLLPVAITLTLLGRVLFRPPPGLKSGRISARIDAATNMSIMRSPSPAQNKICESLVVRRVNYSICDTTASASHNTICDSMSLADMQSSQKYRRSAEQSPILRHSLRRSQSARARASVSRWLLITTVKLLISTPDNVLRLVTFFCACELTRGNKSFMDYFVVAARLLYFAQFWSNAAYLTTIFRNKGTKSRRELRAC